MLRCEKEAGMTGEEKGFAVTGFLWENAALLEQLCPFLVSEDIESGESQTVVISRLLTRTFPNAKAEPFPPPHSFPIRHSSPVHISSPGTIPASKLPGLPLFPAVDPAWPTDK